MRKSTSNALLGLAVRLMLVISVHPPRLALAERHLSPLEMNDKLLSSMPSQTSADNKAVQVKGRHQERRSHVAVLRRALSARRPARGPIPGTVSALTTAANVVATICPHGMLPLGKNNSNVSYVCFDTA
jgi:hypothetical protein